MNHREFTVRELVAELSKHPPDAKVRLEDADTSWTIPIFTIRFDRDASEVWFHPCDYTEMEH